MTDDWPGSRFGGCPSKSKTQGNRSYLLMIQLVAATGELLNLSQAHLLSICPRSMQYRDRWFNDYMSTWSITTSQMTNHHCRSGSSLSVIKRSKNCGSGPSLLIWQTNLHWLGRPGAMSIACADYGLAVLWCMPLDSIGWLKSIQGS